jgi:hypothetical protein
MTLRIDRDRFLFLVSAVGAVACTEHDRSAMFGKVVAEATGEPAATGSSQVSGPPQAPQPGVTTQPPAPSAAKTAAAPHSGRPAVAASAPPLAHAEDTPTVVCGTQNDEGAVDCAPFKGGKLSGPACEGMSGTCDLLAGGKIYRPRAAHAAAACLSRMGTRACDIGVRKRCYDEGVHAACPEAQFASVCQTKIDQCHAAGQRVMYTKEECMKAASALTGGDRTWAIGAMGPSAEGSCRLMFTVF